jgi:choline dehydrogenase-like flavoprotein
MDGPKRAGVAAAPAAGGRLLDNDGLRRGHWDAIVIGTGMGGASLGWGLASRGWRVLFLERGRLFDGPAEGTDDERLAQGLWPAVLQGRTSFGRQPLDLGCGVGGSSLRYGGQLERFRPEDFQAEPVAGAPPRPDWPITYQDLLPHYREAEALFGVTGTPDPLGPVDLLQSLRPPPPLSAADAALMAHLEARGLHPYRAHLAEGGAAPCPVCLGSPCHHGIRRDAATVCVLPALRQHGAALATGCEVLSLAADRRRVESVLLRRHGEQIRLSAGVVVLAAGALMSPRLLLASASRDWPQGLANDSGLVGRHLMFHASDFVALRPHRRGGAALATEGRHDKALSFNDDYRVDGRSFGTWQSTGLTPGPGLALHFLRERSLAWPPAVRRAMWPALRVGAGLPVPALRGGTVLASIVEDHPHAHNRVWWDPTAPGGLRFHYRYPSELRRRCGLMRGRLRKALGRGHWLWCLSGPNNLNFPHACGTCRSGSDPGRSVLDRDNRAHGLDNLYVVDAAFFPSSGGTNPALTIAANALRIASVLHADRGPALAAARGRKPTSAGSMAQDA